MNRLIADSGSTKTEWCLCDGAQVAKRLCTGGINPVYQTGNDITAQLREELLPGMEGLPVPEQIHFYGAGCITQKIPAVEQALRAVFPKTEVIEVSSDMLGAARSLCGHEPGIACILGTGSNSCEYDGENITANIPPLGFILGDEGSGACLGKHLVADLLKNRLPAELKAVFLEKYALDQGSIIDRVYRQPMPNRFLASLTPFIAEHLHYPQMRQLVVSAFTAFLQRNVMQYDWKGKAVHFTGSIAYHFSVPLAEAAARCGIQPGKIEKTPMEGLIMYHYGK